MFAGGPGQDQIRGNSLTATGTLVTIPAGYILTANVQLTASIAVAGSCAPTISVVGVNAAPATGTILCRLSVSGLALSTVADSTEAEIIVKAPPENDITLQFTAGATGTSTATISGWVTT